MASIRERNGSYQITVSCGYDIHGKKLIETTTFKPDPLLHPKQREKAVQEFAQQFEAKVKDGFPLFGSKIVLKDFSEHWINDYAKVNMQPGTVAKYQEELNSKILPELLALQWNDVNFETDVIQVSKSITAVNGEFICKSPKTKTPIAPSPFLISCRNV